MDRHDDVAKHVCTDIIQNGIRQQRYRLKKAYWEKVQHLTPEQAYLMKPTNVDDESWKRLVNNWFDEHYQVNKIVFVYHTICIQLYIIYITNIFLINTEQL